MMKCFKLLCIFSFLCTVAIASELNLYIGTNYIADSTVKDIEKQCNCVVRQNYFNANEEMLAKVIAGSTGYNVIVPTSYAVDQLVKTGKLKPLDKSQLPNLKYIDKKFLNEAYDPGNKYSVPYAYTPVFLSYNVDEMKQYGIPTDTWAAIFDPKYLTKIKGHVTVLDSLRNVMAAALLYLGRDPNSMNKADLEAASDVINKAVPYWAKFDSDSYYRGLIRGDIWLSMGYSIDISKALQDLKAAKSPIILGASLQKEGNMYELDNLVIPVSTPDEKYSYTMINAALDPKNAYALAMMTGASIPNSVAFAKLDRKTVGIDWIYPKNMTKMHVFNAYDQSTQILANQLWTNIKVQSAK